jgi:hypothetical protein
MALGLWLYSWSLGLLRELQQTRLLHNIREEPEQGLIGTEYFANQHEAQ